ncbi:unnamed protein product [Calicophoron daubneyi]|uniref:Uncharacterized protein n=1 Tax=Calicophoron daubneyi TaxID=300641 RepID=A0AAV2TCD3_CALDB
MNNLEDVDALNDETFGAAEEGDWELEHEQFARVHENTGHISPDAEEIPRFWETPGDISFLWQPNVFDTYKEAVEDEGRERGVNVEETLQKLVAEEEVFEDPAILDISRKSPRHNACDSALEKILGAPAYPSDSANLFGCGRDIWSIENGSAQRNIGQHFANDHSSKSVDLLALLQQATRHESENAGSASEGKTDSVALLQKLLSECRTTTVRPGEMRSAVHDKHNVDLDESRSQMQSSGYLTSAADSLKRVHLQTSSPATCGTSITQLNSPRPCLQNTNPAMMAQLRATSQAGNILPILSAQATCPRPVFQSEMGVSALRLLLLNAQNAQLANRAPALLPDPRFFPCIPPPLHPLGLVPPAPPPPPGFMRTPNVGFHPGSIAPRSSLQFFMPQTGPRFSPFPLSNPLLGESTHSSRLGSHETRLGIAKSSHDPLDINKGSWMSEYESMGVLLTYLRPLMVANPYVQDYYFAIRWLRRTTIARSKQLTPAPPPIMHMPSPVTMENLGDPSYYHFTFSQRKFVVPLASLPSFTRPHSPDLNSTETDAESSGSKHEPVTHAASPVRTSSISESSSTLGRPTRSNVYRPRVVAELSLASALSGDVAEGQKSNTEAEEDTASRLKTHPSTLLKTARLRRLLLARIERMYTLVLHIDEVDVSLARVVVQTEMRARLGAHRQDLVEQLVRELVQSSDHARSAESSSSVGTTDQIFIPLCELFTVRKGVRLFASVLHYLPPHLSLLYVSAFIANFAQIYEACSEWLDEFTSLLYPTLRRSIYQTTDIGSFLNSCFPEISEPLESIKDPSPKMKSLFGTKLGTTLVFCVLDACARLSKPDDPSDFIRFGAYFTYIASLIHTAMDHPIEPLELFPHLASILPMYVKPDSHLPLTSNQLQDFCKLIYNPFVSRDSGIAVDGRCITPASGEMKCASANGPSSTTFVRKPGDGNKINSAAVVEVL